MKKYLIGNWKMNFLPKQAESFMSELSQKLSPNSETRLGLAANFLCLPQLLSQHGQSAVWFGAQNAYYEDSGAFTGEVSAKMCADLKSDFVLIGHSERRTVFAEKSDLLQKKSAAVLRHGLTLVFCVGESLAERKAGKTNAVLEDQLSDLFKAIKDVSNLRRDQIIVAYEPVWAIGTGEVASVEQISETTDFVRKSLTKGSEHTAAASILYGGSVKPENYQEIIAVENVNGALVGGASLLPESFAALAKISG